MSNYVATVGDYNLKLRVDFENWLVQEGMGEEGKFVNEEDISDEEDFASLSLFPLHLPSSSFSSPSPRKPKSTLDKWSGEHTKFDNYSDPDDDEHGQQKDD
jgi:hypothetical protein